MKIFKNFSFCLIFYYFNTLRIYNQTLTKPNNYTIYIMINVYYYEDYYKKCTIRNNH